MSEDVFDRLPGDARIWVFGTERALDPGEEERLLEEVDGFLAQWKAHGAPLAAARRWRDGRFLLVGVDRSVTVPSGCSIDALVRTLKGLEIELGVGLVDNAPVYYRETDGIGRVSRAGFRALVEAGAVTPDTVVFDNSITRMDDLREGRWERPARDAWHGRVFFAESAR